MCEKAKQELDNFVLEVEADRLTKHGDNFENSDKYVPFSKEIEDLYHKIFNYLPEDLQKCLLEHTNNYDTILTNAYSYFYKRGLEDMFLIIKGLTGDKIEIKVNLQIN